MSFQRVLAILICAFLMQVLFSGCCTCSKQMQITQDDFASYNKNFKTVMIEDSDDRYHNLQRRVDELLKKIDDIGGEVISVSIVHEYYEYKKSDSMPYSMYHGVITYRIPINEEPIRK